MRATNIFQTTTLDGNSAADMPASYANSESQYATSEYRSSDGSMSEIAFEKLAVDQDKPEGRGHVHFHEHVHCKTPPLQTIVWLILSGDSMYVTMGS